MVETTAASGGESTRAPGGESTAAAGGESTALLVERSSVATERRFTAGKSTNRFVTIPANVGVLDIIEECPMEIQCSSGSMRVVVARSDISDFSVDSLQVISSDQGCLPVLNGSHVIFTVPLYGCGTTRTYHEKAIVYSNTVCFSLYML